MCICMSSTPGSVTPDCPNNQKNPKCTVLRTVTATMAQGNFYTSKETWISKTAYRSRKSFRRQNLMRNIAVRLSKIKTFLAVAWHLQLCCNDRPINAHSKLVVPKAVLYALVVRMALVEVVPMYGVYAQRARQPGCNPGGIRIVALFLTQT